MKRAAWLAMVGVLLRGGYYWKANLLGSWAADIPLDFRVQLVIVAILDPLAWAAYFASVAMGSSVKWPALAAIALGLAQIGLSGYRQFPTFSALSLDTFAYFFGALGLVCWSLVLLAQVRGVRVPRASTMYLLLFGMAEIALTTYNIGNGYRSIWEFGQEAPFVLMVSPAIWMIYWITQTKFVRQLMLDKA